MGYRLKQKINVFDPATGKKRIGVLDCASTIVTTSDRKKRPLRFFKALGEVIFFEKYKNGKQVK